MHYIRLEIHEADIVIDGTHEFLHSGNTLCTVEMSEAQFAQMITQPNMGSGSACTIHYSAGDKGQPWLHPRFGTRPEPPEPERFNIKYDKETAYRAKIITDNLVSIQKTLGDLVNGLTKPNKGTLKEMLAQVESARMEIEQNIPYVQKCAAEKLEKKVGAAVMEFEAYMTRSCEARGLLTMRSEAPVLALESPKAPDGSDVPRLTAGVPEGGQCPAVGHLWDATPREDAE
jgi:hypothetical protein